MATLIYSNTKLEGYTLNIEADLRVIRQLEKRGQELQAQLWKIEERWQKKTDQLVRRQCFGVNLQMQYDFKDILA